MKELGGETQYRLASWAPQGNLVVGGVLIGKSLAFRSVLGLADAVAANDCVVLLEGESGTGKELLARRIHSRSRRSAGPFIPVNCPGISASLFESQFYGHVRGAFTGASNSTLGVVRAAEGGTLLLDEIGELPLHLQPKLLRLLQQGEVTPVGTSNPIAVDVRFIAATNCNLARRAAEGRFRLDLYHRLNIVRIEVPPLRQRKEDINLLIDYYLDYYAQVYEMPPRQISPCLRESLLEYPWPGNVRELCAYLERLYAAKMSATAPVANDWLAVSGDQPPRSTNGSNHDEPPRSLNLAQAEADTIRRALELTQYNRSAAAKLLKIHRSTLLRKIRALGLDR